MRCKEGGAGRTVALDEIEAEAVKADGAQELEPLDDVLAHKVLRMVNVGRRCVILPRLVVPGAPKHRIVVADCARWPRQPPSVFVPPPLLVLPHTSSSSHFLLSLPHYDAGL